MKLKSFASPPLDPLEKPFRKDEVVDELKRSFQMHAALCPSPAQQDVALGGCFWQALRPLTSYRKRPTKNCAATISAFRNLLTFRRRTVPFLCSLWLKSDHHQIRPSRTIGPWSFSLHNSFSWYPLELARWQKRSSHQNTSPGLSSFSASFS